jgi:hypothetical protein
MGSARFARPVVFLKVPARGQLVAVLIRAKQQSLRSGWQILAVSNGSGEPSALAPVVGV